MATANKKNKGIKNVLVKGVSKGIGNVISRFNKDAAGFFAELTDRMVKVTDAIRYEAAIGAECITILGKENGTEKKDINAQVKEAVSPIAGGRMARYYPGVGKVIIKHNLTVNDVAGNFTVMALNVEEFLNAESKAAVKAEVERLKGEGAGSTNKGTGKDKGAQDAKIPSYAVIASALERRIKKDSRKVKIKWSEVEAAAQVPPMSADTTEADRAELLVTNILRLALDQAVATEAVTTVKKTA